MTVTEGLIGMETLTGIPGTVGATPIQNVGAYGQETADTLVEVTAWDWELHRQVVLRPADCRFGHRTSVFKRSTRWTLLRVTFGLTPSKLSAPIIYQQLAAELDAPHGTELPLEDVVGAVLALRRRKGMVLDPNDPDSRSAGSVFLSAVIDSAHAARLQSRGASVHTYPDGYTRVSASYLLQEAGFKLGERLGKGVAVSSKQFTIIAKDGATAESFATAAEIMQQRVRETSGILLSPEPDLVGKQPTYARLTRPLLVEKVGS